MVKFFRIISCIIATILFNSSIIFAQAPPRITVEQVDASPGTSVTVPILLQNNTGICGAVLSISYDDGLILTDVSKGDALSSLIMTPPGNLSANPINIGWDGTESDTTNGVIATLTFTIPDKKRIYNITPYYDPRNIVDGNMNPVNIETNLGQIIVDSPFVVTIEVDDKKVTLENDTCDKGLIFIAFYDEHDKLLLLNNYSPANVPPRIFKPDFSKYAKIMWWNNLSALEPVCITKKIDLD